MDTYYTFAPMRGLFLAPSFELTARRPLLRGNRLKTIALPAAEFLRRFLLHILPAGFVRIRHFGLLANRTRTANLARCRALLGQSPPPPGPPESVAALLRRLTGVDLTRCPVCQQGRLRVVAVFRPGELPVPALDTS